MISDSETKRKKQQLADDEEIRMQKSLIGNCYEYRQNIDDEFLTFIRIISVNGKSIFGPINIHKFSRGRIMRESGAVEASQSYTNLNTVSKMTRILVDEFEYKVSEYLKLIRLQFIPGELS